MEKNKYHASMFNVLVDEKDGLYLYNSFGGIGSIRTVEESARDKVKDILSGREIEVTEDSSSLIQRLIDDRFLVPIWYDEKSDREALFYEYIMDNHLNLVVHTTDACNFRCKYCALDFKSNIISETTQNSIVNYVRKNIHKYNGLSMEWFGGEPLIGIDAIVNMSKQLIEICRKAHVPYSASVTSNGYLLTEENVKKLTDVRVYCFAVTIDGLKTTHDEQRVYVDGGPTWDIIIKNLEGIRDKVKSRLVNVIIRGNFTKQMFDELPEFYYVLNEKFGSDGRFSFFARPAGDWGGDRVKGFLNKLVSADKMELVYKYLWENQKELKANYNLFNISTCGAMCRSVKKNRYVITSYGKIQKCESCSVLNEIGALKENGDMEIDYHKEGMWTVGYRRRKMESCDNCPLSCSCLFGSCPREGVLHQDNKNCGYIIEYKSLIQLAAKTLEVEKIGEK